MFASRDLSVVAALLAAVLMTRVARGFNVVPRPWQQPRRSQVHRAAEHETAKAAVEKKTRAPGRKKPMPQTRSPSGGFATRDTKSTPIPATTAVSVTQRVRMASASVG